MRWACLAGVSEERREYCVVTVGPRTQDCATIGRVLWVHDLALVSAESRAAQRRADRPMHDAINLSCYYYYYSPIEAEQLVDERGRWACQVAGGRRPEGASAPRFGVGFLHMPAHAPPICPIARPKSDRKSQSAEGVPLILSLPLVKSGSASGLLC